MYGFEKALSMGSCTQVTCNLVLSRSYVVGGHSLKSTMAPLRKSRFLETVGGWSVPLEADMIIPGSHRARHEVTKNTFDVPHHLKSQRSQNEKSMGS